MCKLASYKARKMNELSSINCYLYYHLLARIISKGRILKRIYFPGYFIPTKEVLDKCPIFFCYGKRKIGPFHSLEWVARLKEHKLSRAIAYNCGHWITVENSE